MKSYYIDEIPAPDQDKVIQYLGENALKSSMDKLFWINLPLEYLSKQQSEHSDCGPHRFAIETGDDWIKAEFLIRASVKFKCECNGYCDENQKHFIINYIDNLIKKLSIRT